MTDHLDVRVRVMAETPDGTIAIVSRTQRVACEDSALTVAERLIETTGRDVLAVLRRAPLAEQSPDVTALPQVDDDLHVKQPRPEWDVPPDDLGRHHP